MELISESEALALLAQPKHWDLDQEWVCETDRSGAFVLSAGLVDQQGRNIAMRVKLQCRRSKKSGNTLYLFTLYKQLSYGLARVYQIDVQPPGRKCSIRSQHDVPHEHIGPCRQSFSNDWDRSTFEDVAEYFLSRTNITLSRPIQNPLK